MCTAAVYKTKDVYFGRNLDHDMSYGEEVVVTPRNFPFTFRKAGEMKTHYAFIGMAFVAGGYPLFVNGKIVGGIGVGGGTEEQDCSIAEYVVSVFNEMTK